MVFIKKKSIAFDKNDMSKILLMGSLTTSLIVFMTYYIIGTTWNLHQKETIWMMISSVGLVCSDILMSVLRFSLSRKKPMQDIINLKMRRMKVLRY